MGGLTNIIGGATIAVAMAGSVQAEDNLTPFAIDQTINGFPGRVQMHPLPEVDLNFLSPPEEHLRDPAGNFKGYIQPYDSIGDVDERRAPTHGEREYDPVVQMVDETGWSFCTATISNIEGFELREAGTIFTTAAHCLDEQDSAGNIIGIRAPENIFFKGSYLDDSGQIQIFTMRGDEVWVDPLYQENIYVDEERFEQHGYYFDRIAEADTAIIFSKQITPDEVTPARMFPIDFETASGLSEQLLQAQYNDVDIRVTVAGYAGDKPYLTTHENARVVYGDSDGINTESDIVPGSSGGPVFLSGVDEQPIALTDDGEPIIIAVNSTVISETDSSRHAYFNGAILPSVPFLKLDGSPSDEICFQTAEITASSLRIRALPSVYSPELAARNGQEDSRLPMGSQVSLYGTTRNELGQEWGLVSTPEGRTGYISMNRDYVDVQPEVCIPKLEF